MGRSRTAIIAKNSIYSLFCYFGTLLLQFVVRTLFIKCLSIEYVGIQGLFTNILTVLSFAELGIGNAVSFSLYKPLAENNQYKVAQLIKFYKTVYRLISLTVFVLGVGITPFLYSLIREKPDIPENLYIIYLLFVLNTAVSYLFVHKQTLLLADQKKYIVSLYTIIITTIVCIIQCICLLVFHSIYAYLIVMLIGVVATNVVLSIKCNREYPSILSKDISSLEKKEKLTIFDNVKSLFYYRIGNVILNGSGNILISKLFGITILGLCSNFYYAINAIIGVFSQVLVSFVATIGNLNAVEDEEKKMMAFYKTSVFCFWLYGFICTGFFMFLNDFITLWIGEQYTLNWFVVFSIVLVFYVDNVCFPLSSFRVTMGLFRKARFSPIIASVSNIALAILLSRVWGVAGVFLAVSVSRFLFVNLVDIYLIFKYGFKRKSFKYFVYYIVFTLFCILAFFLIKYVIMLIDLSNMYVLFISRLLVFTIGFNLLFVVLFYKLPDFKGLQENFLILVNRKNS